MVTEKDNNKGGAMKDIKELKYDEGLGLVRKMQIVFTVIMVIATIYVAVDLSGSWENILFKDTVQGEHFFDRRPKVVPFEQGMTLYPGQRAKGGIELPLEMLPTGTGGLVNR